ncbi:aminotransferase class III-fold pyridoxal phosphate-dependent enzyme [Luteibacter sp.]|uniref:aminotransferase class III-fold pyridoxal phosphate-dependent enzyme n=1 Tax=Luteibacter sp. TaxID=1886636 RepID=UPI0025C060D8|nr:aminotransferase class III-fold pyridoxal phosphate-dependent enzyme [Luteibacter sp.]
MYGHESTRLLPADFPQFFQRAQGTRLWDVDGNEYIDYMCAFGPNLLGYGHEAVEAAARAQAHRGDTMTGPSDAMVRLAELFVDTVSHADWAMFCKNGTDATAMALVCARAHRQRRKVLLAQGAYHGAAPWCMPQAAGSTPEDRAHIIPFRYNDLDSLAAAVELADNDLAGIFATPFRHEAFSDQYLPGADYARAVRRVCDERDALLVVDDVRAGFRMARDCSWSATPTTSNASWTRVSCCVMGCMRKLPATVSRCVRPAPCRCPRSFSRTTPICALGMHGPRLPYAAGFICIHTTTCSSMRRSRPRT